MNARASLRVVVACGLVAAIALGTTLWLRGAREPVGDRIAATVSVASALAEGDTRGVARATGPRDFSFPRDHGPHPEFRTEWWYFTGNLQTRDGRHVGFELTFFRNALSPASAARDSAWGTTQVYLAHFAVTDTARQRFV